MHIFGYVTDGFQSLNHSAAETYFKEGTGRTCPPNIWEGGIKYLLSPPNLWQTQGHCPYCLNLPTFFQRLSFSWDEK